MQIAKDPKMLKIPGVFWKKNIENSNTQVGQSILRLIAQTFAHFWYWFDIGLIYSDNLC